MLLDQADHFIIRHLVQFVPDLGSHELEDLLFLFFLRDLTVLHTHEILLFASQTHLVISVHLFLRAHPPHSVPAIFIIDHVIELARYLRHRLPS